MKNNPFFPGGIAYVAKMVYNRIKSIISIEGGVSHD